MTAISNTTLWRTHPQKTKYFAYIDSPPSIYTRRISQASFTYPIVQLTYDNPDANSGVHGDVKIGMTVEILSSSGEHKGFARSKGATSTVLLLSPTSQGEINFADNDIIKVLDDYRIWAKIPLISPTGIQFKDWDFAFSAAGAQPPVAVINGGWYATNVAPGQSKTITLDGTLSFAIADGESIASYSWSIGDGTVVTGSTTASSLTASFPPGRRWIDLLVFDTTGLSHKAHCLIVICDDTTLFNLPINVTKLTGSIENGWEASVIPLEKNIDEPRRFPLIIWAEETYGTTTGSLNGPIDRAHVKFWGWTSDDSNTITPDYGDISINAHGPLGAITNLPAFSQITENLSPPITWFNIEDQTVWKHIHYLLHWQTTILDVCPIIRPSWWNLYPYKKIEASEGTIYDQLKFVAEAMGTKVTCDKNGTIRFNFDPQIISSASQAALTTVVSLSDADWFDSIEIDRKRIKELYLLKGMAIISDISNITVVSSIAPGVTPGQGLSGETKSNMLILSQTALNERIGREYAFRNREIQQVTMNIINGGLCNDPGWLEKVKVTTNIDDAIDTTFVDKEFILDTLELIYDEPYDSAVERWTLIPLTSGNSVVNGLTVQLPGAAAPIGESYLSSDGFFIDPLVTTPYDGPVWDEMPISSGLDFSEPNFFLPEELEPSPEPPPTDVYDAFACTSNGFYHCPDDPSGVSFTWTQLKSGTTFQFVVDPFSPYIGNKNLALRGWICQSNGVYYNDNILGGGTWDSKITLTDYLYLRALENNEGEFVLYNDQHGVGVEGTKIRYFQDFGDTLVSTEEVLSPSVYGAALDVDDYNLGIIIGGAAPLVGGTSYSTSYSGTLAEFDSGFFDPARIVRSIRIPRKLITSSGPNNSSSSLELLACFDEFTPGPDSIWLVTFNAGSNSASYVSIDPVDSGDTYFIAHPFGIETYGEDSSIIYAECHKSGDSYSVLANYWLFKTTDGGTTWTKVYNSSATVVHVVPIYFDGDGDKIWETGTDVGYSTDGGTTVKIMTGNLTGALNECHGLY